MIGDFKLSPNFWLSEMTVTQHMREGISNQPGPVAIKKLKVLAETLEEVRELLGNHAIIVSSGYRSKRVNTLVGGSETSAHMEGWAADFIVPGYGRPLEVCKAIAKVPGIKFDQLIHEYGRWVHLGVGPGWRSQLLTRDRIGWRVGLFNVRS